MKKLKKFIEDWRNNGEAETEVVISIWHIIAFVALIAMIIYTCNR